MTPAAKLEEFKAVLTQILEDAQAANETPDFAGAIPRNMLEHNTRRVALDPLLEALGWSFRDRTEEARVAGDTTLFIDYLGIDQETRSAELIFEAKAWNASWLAGIGDAYRGRPAAELVAAAVDHLNNGAPKLAPITDEWIKRIQQLRDYVVAIEAKGGAVVKRAVIGCARWIVVFKDPEAAFITKRIKAEDVLALELGEMVERSDEIFGLLSIDSLKVAPRTPIHPNEIALHIENPADIRRVFRALFVNRANTTDEFSPQPSIYVSPWLIVERSDGALLEIRPHEQPEILPTSMNFLEMHLPEVSARSDKMLSELSAAYRVSLPGPSPIGEFPNFETDLGLTPIRRSTTKAGNFLIATGEDSHYLRPGPLVECTFHSHEACRQAEADDEPQPVNLRSYERRSYFVSGEPHHCAHRSINVSKKGIPCPLAVFEEKLCCRACTLQDWCWSPERLRRAPCGGGSGAD